MTDNPDFANNPQSEFDPNKNIEKINELAFNVYVHGRIPAKAEINGIQAAAGIDSGMLRTIDARTGKAGPSLTLPEHFRDLNFKNYDGNPENDATLFLNFSILKDQNNQEVERIQCIGVQQPNPVLEDNRMQYLTSGITFQFDLPIENNRLFTYLLTKDRDRAPQNIQQLLERLYSGLISVDENEKTVHMKRISQVVVIDKNFQTSRNKFRQLNPKMIFPSSSK